MFFSTDKISRIKKNLISYGNDHFPRGVRSFYISVVENAFQFSIIFLLVTLSLFFIINILLVFIILNYTIRKKSYKEKFEKVYSKMYEEVLLSYLFGSIDWETAFLKLRGRNKPKNRRILTSVLMNFNTNFKGEFESLIPEIYTRLGLQHDSMRLARSGYNHKKVAGIIELTHLYPEGAKGIIDKLINDPSDYVRAEAQTAYVKLNPETPFNFFYQLEQPFAMWTQLSVFNLIRVHQLPVPSFAQFLTIRHPNIRNFSLRMITFFQQLENVPDILKMVDSKLDKTRFLTYKAINNLRLYDSRDLIKNRFENETEKNKLEIIRALRNIGTEDDFGFLEIIMTNGTMSLKTEACRSMYFMSPKSRERLLEINNQSNDELKLLIAHVTDPRN
ncbi:hypothetical protein [Maribellus sp. YY47]|uniref:hypothetical protein n=1 Tax=Maribellus sp. YY47 TaxID=2929486 RepID=UPI00200105D6|nr:hypothetical protein [Maribellus sp. YY47]MCK3683021.1 hypothetical protein [Maribellus sp. YY47]